MLRITLLIPRDNFRLFVQRITIMYVRVPEERRVLDFIGYSMPEDRQINYRESIYMSPSI